MKVEGDENPERKEASRILRSYYNFN